MKHTKVTMKMDWSEIIAEMISAKLNVGREQAQEIALHQLDNPLAGVLAREASRIVDAYAKAWRNASIEAGCKEGIDWEECADKTSSIFIERVTQRDELFKRIDQQQWIDICQAAYSFVLEQQMRAALAEETEAVAEVAKKLSERP